MSLPPATPAIASSSSASFDCELPIALLAGDIFGKTPIRASIFALKAMYYPASPGHLGRSLAFRKRRRFDIRVAEVPAS